MKMLFWTVLIFAGIWYFMRKWAGGNDLTAHLQEQTALQSIGVASTSVSRLGNQNFPLTTIGQTPLAGMQLDPFNASNPFAQPQSTNFLAPDTAPGGTVFGDFGPAILN